MNTKADDGLNLSLCNNLKKKKSTEHYSPGEHANM